MPLARRARRRLLTHAVRGASTTSSAAARRKWVRLWGVRMGAPPSSASKGRGAATRLGSARKRHARGWQRAWATAPPTIPAPCAARGGRRDLPGSGPLQGRGTRGRALLMHEGGAFKLKTRRTSTHQSHRNDRRGAVRSPPSPSGLGQAQRPLARYVPRQRAI